MDARVAAFLTTAVVLVAVPGPSVAFAVARALSVGRRRALATVVGNAVGLLAQAAALAVGLGELIETSVVVFTVVKLAGATYLVHLGVTAIRHRWRAGGVAGAADPSVADPSAEVSRPGVARSVLDGVVVGVLNPKTIVFFAAFLPLFVDPGGDATLQILAYGAIFAGIAVALDSVWVVAAASARAWLGRSPRRLARLNAAGGVVTIGLGVGAATAERAA